MASQFFFALHGHSQNCRHAVEKTQANSQQSKVMSSFSPPVKEPKAEPAKANVEPKQLAAKAKEC